MWITHEVEALKVGVSLEYYWGDMTPKVYNKYREAYQEKLQDDMQARDINNHILGRYIRTAISDVLGGRKDYPKEPQLAKPKKSTLKRTFTPEETQAFLAKMKQQERKADD